ncbi:endonuclease/exonuclease/phosphatase family protein [Algoriphagus sp.]|uniref:endonuclease/exonuclease/phosphatase family protein n=1 Tax=Algoriphagus sp. TaxID=1872435 RepID=UPI002721D7D8|nr:endonuclease/exonuclease/phosphatase family protein [Algoriphagus sp.]MDO8965959.1 endonuclease/exonuclease/phosphatase family protein [Algoriphagus sp.]MDP3198485.1 endonuclease/exonuclease/phosphatase family protein [Algoriphagus sp.]
MFQKSFSTLLLTITLIFGFSENMLAQSHRIATFNIRWDNPGDEGNLWKDRLPHVVGLIQFHQISLFGTQETLVNQLKQINEGLGYLSIGVGRDDGKEKGEFSPIHYDPKQYQLEDSGTFWLSPTPDSPSKGWDAALNRICTWGRFKDKKGKKFYVFNVHYDHIGQQAREESSKLLVAKVKEINTKNLPVILMGDFNVTPENPAYATITSDPSWEDARLVSKLPSYGPKGTFNSFDWNKMPDGIIDHIFIQGKIQVIRHGILTDNYGKKYPSDHFPVMAEVVF